MRGEANATKLYSLTTEITKPAKKIVCNYDGEINAIAKAFQIVVVFDLTNTNVVIFSDFSNAY
jgi:hypothetical protein